jgi:urease accessory protein
MSLARLLQLASPALPVGAFSYSGGLEAAVEAGIVTDRASAERWIGDVLELTMARMDAPLLLKLLKDGDSLESLNDMILATRETAELRAESVQMGASLLKLLEDLDPMGSDLEEASFPAAFALAACRWRLDPESALVAFLWSWLENQVMAAVKAVPLGQTDGQRILVSLGGRLSAIAQRAGTTSMENFAPGLAMLSSRHETQYSRLFRS